MTTTFNTLRCPLGKSGSPSVYVLGSTLLQLAEIWETHLRLCWKLSVSSHRGHREVSDAIRDQAFFQHPGCAAVCQSYPSLLLCPKWCYNSCYGPMRKLLQVTSLCQKQASRQPMLAMAAVYPCRPPIKSRSLLLSPQIEGKLQWAIGRNYKHPVLITDSISSIPLKSKIPSHKCKFSIFCPIYLHSFSFGCENTGISVNANSI